VLVPVVASTAVQAGLLDLTGALLVCLGASLVGLALYAELRIPVGVRERAARRARGVLTSATGS
jgi:hypothetical protein